MTEHVTTEHATTPHSTTPHTATAPSTTSAWAAFWNRGGWWKLVLLVVAYMAIYLGSGLLIGLIFADQVGTGSIFSSGTTVFLELMLPLIIGSFVLAAFAYSVGWLRPLFARQPVRGRWWMWFAPAFIAAAIILRFLGIDYASYPTTVVVLTLLSGVCIGFTEELLTRGFAVKMLRDSGKSEWTVMVVSSLIFALLHSTNLLSGMPLITVLATIGFTFGFGICMYLTLRVTGNLVWPMIFHALYDPTLFLSTGGIDTAAVGEQSPFLVIAGPANMVFLVIAIIGLIAVRGRVSGQVSGQVSTAPASFR